MSTEMPWQVGPDEKISDWKNEVLLGQMLLLTRIRRKPPGLGIECCGVTRTVTSALASTVSGLTDMAIPSSPVLIATVSLFRGTFSASLASRIDPLNSPVVPEYIGLTTPRTMNSRLVSASMTS